MDYDRDAPFALSDYRRVQRAIPGVEALYGLIGDVIADRLPAPADILIAGGGGGRELELIAPLGHRMTIVDPSAGMLDIARAIAAAMDRAPDVTWVHGEITQAPQRRHDAATSLLVLHFLPDDGTKLAYLREIRSRLVDGGALILADVSFDGPDIFDQLAGPYRRHAERNGLSAEEVSTALRVIGSELPVISPARTQALAAEAGFGTLIPLFRGLCYAAWWTQAR